MTDLINTNRLRVSLFDVKRVLGYPRRSRQIQLQRYHSRDHGQRRLETNIILSVCDWHLGIKWRPDGKRRAADNGSTR